MRHIIPDTLTPCRAILASTLAALLLLATLPAPATAQVTARKQAIAEAASDDDAIAAYYRQNDYAPIWTGADDDARARRVALISALRSASLHGLPAARYDPDGLIAKMAAARTTRDLGFLDVDLSRAFLAYARDIQSGVVVPSSIDSGMVRVVKYRDRTETLAGLVAATPAAYIAGLAPQSREYRALLREKMRLEKLVANGGWGRKVPAGALKPGQSGNAVVALRDRLTEMGFLGRSAARSYDVAIQKAVLKFQESHGLEADGIADAATIKEINVSAEARLKAVIVALERERWLNGYGGDRQIKVNLADFTATIVDFGEITFQTRAVVGKSTSDRRTPEFSDEMEHMVINPSWYVPRSIIVKEYLPKLRANPGAVSHLEITDSRGRRVNRSTADFSQYSARSFPYAMRQPPGPRNALGKVKFMFPNKYNIYLHDTPAKNLFAREVRAYSHGCIRLARPFDFAYAILSRQSDDPEALFQGILKSGKETKLMLDQPIPVHLIYRTAFTTITGDIEFRRDVYGRDAKIWSALSQAGVALNAVRG